MANKPPYTITEKAADYLAKIVETATRLEFGTDFKRNIQLHRKNRLRTIHSSLAIEVNTLSLDEVTAVLDRKLVTRKQEEIKEVKNAYDKAKHTDVQESDITGGEGEFVENADKFVEKFVDTDTQWAIVRLLIAQPTISAKKIAEEVGMSSPAYRKA
jgi:Fic family protein